MDDRQNTKEYSLTIDDGVLYADFFDESCLENILEAELEAIELIRAKNIHLIPLVITMSGVNQSRTDLNVTNLSKVISSNEIIRHLSGIWVVGAEKNIKRICYIMNKVFLDNRIHLVDTLAEAKKDAIACKSIDCPILEQQ